MSGSLLSLFSHPDFEPALLFEYLFRSFDTVGVHEFLVNRMFSLPDVEVERFLPQLMCLLCSRSPRSASLERFILDRCARSMHLALKVCWHLQALAEDGGRETAYARSLRAACETALVNGTEESERGEGDEAAANKVGRSEYFSRVTQLVERLVRVSSALRTVPSAERARALHEQLAAAGTRLGGQAAYVPLWPADSAHFDIVRLPPGEGTVLNSRDRVPYMIFVEVLVAPVECSATPNVHHLASEQGIESLMVKLGRRAAQIVAKEEETVPQEKVKALEKWAEGQTENGEAKEKEKEEEGGRDEKKEEKQEEKQEEEPARNRSETWDERKARLRKTSPVAAKEGERWDVKSFIVKFGDDCRQELLAVQLLGAIKRVFDQANLPLWLYPHGVLVVGRHAALIETIPNVKSIHLHKKSFSGRGEASVSAMFEEWFGGKTTLRYERAQKNFVESLAGYSVASYILQVKDRHNGNLLLDNEGRMYHIDFGFLLGQSPGGISFESAPFKLVQEWVDVMGGKDSDLYNYFKALLVKGFAELQKHKDRILMLVEMMQVSRTGKQPITCLQAGGVVEALRARLESVGRTEEDVVKNVLQLLNSSLNATSTNLYDRFQFSTNQILY